MTPPPRIRYFVSLPNCPPQALEAAKVLAWVEGFAAARGESHVLDQVDKDAAEDTRRVQTLQVGEKARWFTYLYQERDEDIPGDTRDASARLTDFLTEAAQACGDWTSLTITGTVRADLVLPDKKSFDAWRVRLGVEPLWSDHQAVKAFAGARTGTVQSHGFTVDLSIAGEDPS